MRIRRLELVGFGPFRERQEVDFEAFDADGLFLIAGETGAGKSTILDGIAYALYGRTPRWEDSAATRVGDRVRSDYCGPDDPTSVRLEFEVGGAAYRVRRSPAYERPKGRGHGTTTQPSSVLVEARDGEGWHGIAAKEREAAEVIGRLLKLTADEFQQVILLAQGRFQAFLLAGSEERLGLLSKLFGAARFRDYQERLRTRAAELARRVEAAEARRAALLDGVEAPEGTQAPPPGGELEWLDGLIAQAAARRRDAEERLQRSERQEEDAARRLTTAQRQRQHAQATRRLAELEERAPEIGRIEAELGEAERAERVRPLIAAADAAAARRREAELGLETARAHYTGGTADAELADEVRRLDGELARLADAVADEARAADLDAAHARSIAAAEDAAARLAGLDRDIDALRGERDGLLGDAARRADHEAAVERLQARSAAAAAARRARDRLQEARAAQLAAERRVEAARSLANELLERFLGGQAAGLAARLTDGEPCPVCGSREHPAPAVADGPLVDEAALDDARAAADALEPEARAARAHVDACAAEAERLAGAAGDADADALDAELAAARAELAAATEAQARLADIDEALGATDGAGGVGGAGLLADRAALAGRVEAEQAEATRLGAQLHTLRQHLERARGDHPSVAARREAAERLRLAAAQLQTAIADLAAADAALVGAETALDAQCAQEGFADRQAVAAALRDETRSAELRARIDEHRTATSEALGVLKLPELQELPAEPIDLEAARSAAETAKAAVKDAVAEQVTARSAAETLQRRRDELETLLASSRELLAEHELVHRLAETVNGRGPNVKGMSLESYYVAAEFEDVLAAANVRLGGMSNGRYALQHTERGTRRANAAAGLELEVMDEYTGRARDPHTLSGGEQFLASLALALGLAEIVTSRAGGVELETLFVDEGFGSLSPEYLDIAMATLDSLKQGGRTVGVISHVESMQEAIAAQLRVVREPGGGSRIEPGTPPA